MTLIVTEQEAMLSSILATEQQKMPVPRLHVENNQFFDGLSIPRNEEELSLGIRADIEGKALKCPSSPDPARSGFVKFHSCSHLLEGTLQQLHLYFPI